MKYNVGDRVRIVKKWNKDTNQNSAGEMDKWLGKVMTIRDIKNGRYHMEEDKGEHYGDGWNWNEACIEGLAHECNQKIVITSKNGETLARLYDGNKVIKSATAKCCPDDEFDFKFGANLAYERLMSEEKPKSEEKPDAPKKCKFEVGQYYEHDGLSIKGIIKITKVEDNRVYYEIVDGMKGDSSQKNFTAESGFAMCTTPVTWKVVNRPVKKGDYVRIVKPSFGFNTVGDILKVHKPHGDGILVLDKHHPRSTDCDAGDDYEWCYCKWHFEVVELPSKKKSEPKPEPKPTFKEGDRVRHDEYGEGTVICMAYDGDYGVEFDEKKGWCHNCDGLPIKWGKRGTKSTSTWCRPETLTLITEKPKKQKYNGKVVCIDNCHNKTHYTVGKVYQFKDGVITLDDGDQIGDTLYSPIYTFKDWARFSSSKFIEVVE